MQTVRVFSAALLLGMLHHARAAIGMGYYPIECTDPLWQVEGWQGGGNVQQALADVDKDLDGTITDEELRADTYDYDADGNGFVVRCEFVQRTVERYLIPKEEANTLFGMYDINRDGRLDYLDLDRNAADINQDGRLDVCELRKIMVSGWVKAKADVFARRLKYEAEKIQWQERVTGIVQTWSLKGLFAFMADFFSL